MLRTTFRLQLAWLGLLSLIGCVRFVSPLPVTAMGDITARIDATPQRDPVIPMRLPHHAPTACEIALIDLDGILLDDNATGLGSRGENCVSLFRERLDAIERRPQVKAVVLRIHSPGGSVTATDIMWRDLQSFRRRTHLPVVACLMDVATGGAYYIATGTDLIIAHPTSITGAIGCILNLYNLEDLMGQFNIVGVPVKSGDNIDLGSPSKAVSDDGRKLLQAMAEEFHTRFKKIVTDARQQVDANQTTTFDGRVFTASQALELGLIDKIGYVDHAIQAARTLSHAPHADPVFFHRPDDPAASPYAITPNLPLQDKLLPINVPGLNRARLPSFLYLWDIDPTLEASVAK